MSRDMKPKRAQPVRKKTRGNTLIGQRAVRREPRRGRRRARAMRVAVHALPAGQSTLPHDRVEYRSAEQDGAEHDGGKSEIIEHDMPFRGFGAMKANPKTDERFRPGQVSGRGCFPSSAA